MSELYANKRTERKKLRHTSMSNIYGRKLIQPRISLSLPFTRFLSCLVRRNFFSDLYTDSLIERKEIGIRLIESMTKGINKSRAQLKIEDELFQHCLVHREHHQLT